MGFAYVIFFIVPKLIAHYLPGLIFLSIALMGLVFLATVWAFSVPGKLSF